GAALRATGNVGTGLSDLKVANAGALLRASGQVQADPLRAGGPNSGGTLQVGSNAVLASAGSLSLDAGKGMQVNGSLDVDSSGTLSLYAPGINIGDLSQVSGNTTALGLSESLLPSFNSLSQLSLNGNGQPIYFWGNVTLGSSALKALNISSSGFVNGGGGNVSIQANTLNLTGSTGTPPTAINGDAGTLTVTAATIGVGSNTFALAGFADAALNASAKVMANGTAGVLSADQELDISTPLITGSSGSSASFVALGDMHLSQSSSPAAGTAAGLGVSLSFQAQDIYSNTNIFVPSGQISMSAVDSLKLTGGTVSAAGAVASFNGTSVATPGGAIVLSASDLEVESGATLNVSAMSAAAGSLQLAAQTNLLLQGTLVGNSTNPDGKTLSNLAQGQFQLSYAGAAPQDFGAFNDMLNSTTVGFTQSRSFRYGSGNVVLAGSDQIVANQVSIAVDNGNINIGGQAIINASGPEGGSISLYAAQPTASGSNGTITISGQALLQARGNSAQTGTGGTNGNGGTVLLSSGNTDGSAPLSVNGGASLNLLGGTIDVTGATGASNGSVTLRAPRTAGGTDLAVASINTQIVGSAQTVLEGYKVYQATSISEQPDSSTNSSINLDATTSGQMYQDATLFGNSAAAILSRLGAPTLEVRPGIEVQSSGNLTVSVNEFATNPADRGWNLDAWRFGGQPINLTLQAAGTLDIIGSISDGFVKSTNPKLSMPDWSLDTGASANLTLVGGADQHAARVTDTIAGAGDVVVQFAARTPDPGSATPIEVAGTNTVVAQNPNAPITATDEPVAVVRTGTGSISISSGRDVVLGMAPFYVFATADDTNGTPVIYDKQVQPNGFAVSLFGASIYTAGQATSASAPNFVLPQNALNTQFGGTGMSPASFASGGGAISINADRDIIGAQSTTAWYYRNSDGQPAATGTPVQLGTEVPLSQVVPQLVDNWLFRQGRTSVDANGNVSFEVLGASNAVLSAGDTLNTAWWVRTDYFDSGIATFAGGDLSINAGRNISNLYASAATDALAQTAGQAPTQWGGGNLQVVAGGNILGGQFYVQKGTMNIQAAGSLVQGLLEPSASVGTASTAFYPILALGDAQANVVAGGSLGIETVYNPTITEQSLFNQNLSGASPVYSPTSAF
ncbi:MAG: hypothetical protein JO370_15470, partial [Paucibacter sp.]|nr:hypothetical protein [Roseateles sp.]